MDPKQWGAALVAQANAEGLTDEKLRNQLMADGQAVIASRSPKPQDVLHGIPQLKAGAAPKDIVQHYMDAASRVAQSGLPDDQKKLLVDQFQKMAAAAQKSEPPQMTPYQSARLKIEQQNANRPRGGGSLRGADGLTPYEEIENRRWNQTHNPDGSPKAPRGGDTSGLNNAGKEMYQRDMTIWATQGMNGDPPDPTDPKYPKRSASGGGAVAKTPIPAGTHPGAMLNGKPIFVQGNRWVFQDGSPAQ